MFGKDKPKARFTFEVEEGENGYVLKYAERISGIPDKVWICRTPYTVARIIKQIMKEKDGSN